MHAPPTADLRHHGSTSAAPLTDHIKRNRLVMTFGEAEFRYRDIRQTMVQAAWTRVLSFNAHHSGIEFLDIVTVDDYLTATLGTWGGYLVQVMPMIFNDRLVLTPARSPQFIEHGWCYSKGGAAGLAALAWSPDVQAEPLGFIKRTGPLRRAGETATI